MTWPFCPLCGTILDLPETDNISCSFCPYKSKFSELNAEEIITTSPATQKPQWILEVEEKSEKLNSISEKHATIEEPCPKCSHPELYFYTMQLRSVDEGSTVFYECPKCSYKFSVNN